MEKIKEEFKSLVLELLDISEDSRENEILERLDRICPDPEYMNYIYHSDKYGGENMFDMEAFIEKVFSYKPIVL